MSYLLMKEEANKLLTGKLRQLHDVDDLSGLMIMGLRRRVM